MDRVEKVGRQTHPLRHYPPLFPILPYNLQIPCGYSVAYCDAFGLRSGRAAGLSRILGLISVGGVWQAGFPCFGAEQGIYQGLITGNFAIPMLAAGERHAQKGVFPVAYGTHGVLGSCRNRE